MVTTKMITPVLTNMSPEEADTARKAYLYLFKDLIEILELKDEAKASVKISSVKLPTTDKQGNFKWSLPVPTRESVVHLPTPPLTKQEIMTLLYERTEEENQRLALRSSSFTSVGSVAAKINKTLKTAASRVAGVFEILNNFSTYHADLLKAYHSAGFRNRKDYFAKLQLITNLFKRFSEQDFKEIKSKATFQDEILVKFFEEQTWEVSSERLKASLVDLSLPSTNAGHVISIRNEVQSSALDEPSLIIPMSCFFPSTVNHVLPKIIEWLKDGENEFYMIKIITDLPPDTSMEHIQAIVSGLTSFMTEVSKNKVDLLSFIGTSKLSQLRYASGKQPKLVDVFLKYLLEHQNVLECVQKFDISDNYISRDTFKLLSEVLGASKHIQDLNISGLVLGEHTIINLSKISPTLSAPPCCFCCCPLWSCAGRCSCYPILCCKPRCCLPTHPQLDYEGMHEKVLKKVDEVKGKFSAEVKTIVEGIELLIAALERRAASDKQGRLRSFIAKNFDFSGLCFSTSQIERLLTAIARCNPFAVAFTNSHLTDKNIMALGSMISENPSLLHFNISGTKLFSLDSWNVFQKLTASSFLIVSMPLPELSPTENVPSYYNVTQPTLGMKERKESFAMCCTETKNDITLHQSVEPITIQVGAAEDVKSSLEVVVNAIRNEIIEHRLLPYNKVFTQLFGSDPKYLKVLKDMMDEQYYAPIFGLPIENEKELAFMKFKVDIKEKAKVEGVVSDVNASVILDYNDLWKIDEGWDELSKTILNSSITGKF